MTIEKKDGVPAPAPSRPGPPEDDADWKNALDEWDEKAFLPEVAHDQVTKKPATLGGEAPERPAARQLYRPPTGPTSSGPRLGAKPGQLPAAPPSSRRGPPALHDAGADGQDAQEEDFTVVVPYHADLLKAQSSPTLEGPRRGSPTVRPEEDDVDVDVEMAPPPAAGRAPPRSPPAATTPSDDDVDALLGDPGVAAARPEAITYDPETGDLRAPISSARRETISDSIEALDAPSSPSSSSELPLTPTPSPDLPLSAAPSPARALAPPTPLPPPPAPPPPTPLPPPPTPLPPILPEELAPLIPPSEPPGRIVPEPRVHDPDAETSVFDLATAREGLGSAGSSASVELADGEPSGSSEAEAATGLRRRTAWLEAEAAARTGADRARILLALSEIAAIAGEEDQAAAFAADAREAAPELLLAHKQARALAAPTPSGADLAELLKNEALVAEAPEARTHALLLAADALRFSSDEPAASRAWDELLAGASKDDPRPAIAKAASLLGRGDAEALEALAATPAAESIRDALLAALALRGAGSLPPRPADLTEPDPFENVRPNDALRRARLALRARDMVTAFTTLGELRDVPELARAAGWLSASIGGTQPETARAAAAGLLGLVRDGETSARRALAARAVELGDVALADAAIDEATFSTADRAVIRTLLELDPAARDVDAEALAISGPMSALAFGVAAHTPPRHPAAEGDVGAERAWVEGRAERLAGNHRSRSEVRLARVLAADAPGDVLAAAIGSLGSAPLAEAAGISIELEARTGAWSRVAEALEGWESTGEGAHATDGALAAGLIAERVGDRERARRTYDTVLRDDPQNEGLVRALAGLDPSPPIGERLSTLADALGDTVTGALARLEAVMRASDADGKARNDLLERAHRAAPGLPMAAFLGRRDARKAKDATGLLRWMDEARAGDADASERALIAAGQAHVLARVDPRAAADRAEEAHKARPDDIALRELYERLSPDPAPDQGAWREERAAKAVGSAKAVFYMEAAHRYELEGDKASALRAAEAAVASGDSVLARLARERAELEAGAAARLADELLVRARETESPEERREAYMRLADLDAVGRADPASALLWHRSILEEAPTHKPSLRYLEHAFIGDGRDEELEPIVTSIARALDGTEGGEGVAHADLAARLRARGATGSWETTREVAELAARQPTPSLSSQRLLNAHGRFGRDDALVKTTTLALVAKATRPSELAVLLLRAGEAAARLGDLASATEYLDRAKNEDPGDVPLWGLLADVRQRSGDTRGAAEACESLARTSTVAAHRRVAWHDAATHWLDEVHDDERGVAALEQVAGIDLDYADVFPRLSALYKTRGDKHKLAGLLERRIASVSDPHERVAMEVERGRTLADIGDTAGARKALAGALEAEPDSTAALSHFAELSARERDWDAAEQAWVRLARLLGDPGEQREVYARLGELYSVHSVNLERAELALKEVLKRAPSDVATLEHLVDVYRRLGDAAHAIEVQQLVVAGARDPVDRRTRLIELAAIHEAPGNDTRRAEQVLEAARREFPADVTILRALAEFYVRHKQMPAVQILLDRAAADARRAFAAGRLAPELFEIMRTVFDLRGRGDASRIVAATLAAFAGQPAVVRGGDARALDPRLDDVLAPDVLSPALRALLVHTGAALNAAVPVDLRALQAVPLGPSGATVRAIVDAVSAAAGLGAPNVHVSPVLGRSCIPASSDPPTLIVGEELLTAPDGGARAFMIVRAVKLIAARASALVRAPSAELGVLISAWLQAFNPNWMPEGVDPTELAAASRKIAATFPRKLPPDLAMLALEVAGSLGVRAPTLGAVALAWANRAALLAVGDPNAALTAIAWSLGVKEGPPASPSDRAAWISSTPEARDLLTFSIGDAYSEARERLGLDR